MGLRRWLLSRQAQLTIQLSVSLVLSSLFTLWSPIHFSHACLVPVFVAVIVGSLAQDQHIGTRLQVSAWILGPTWVASILAGGLMSLAKLAAPVHPHPQLHSVPTAGYAVATVLLALLGLGLLVFLQAVTPPGPGRVMGIIAVLIYGIMTCLSTLYPNVGSMWVGAVWLVVLGTAVAAVVGLLVGWLVMPSLASDEVWRLTAEALQGAGTVLSYHCSLLMVDEPTAAAGAAGSSGSPPASAAAAWRQPKDGTAAQHHRAGRKPHQKQGQQHHSDWAVKRRKHAQQPVRSSIEIAAAGAAVVAASQDAHRPAAEAAAVALSWVDEADTRSISGSTDSQHSSGYSITSLLGSDAIADAAAELSKRFQEEEDEEQQDGTEAPAGEQTGLNEQLLQQADQALLGPPAGGGNMVDAWVSAVAVASLSRRGSATLPARLSEDSGSTSTSISGSILAAGLPGHTTPQQQQRRSLEGAASLDFMEELDDSAFIQYMRVLSQSNSRPAAARPAAAAADASALTRPLASRSSQPAAAAAEGGGNKGRLPHSKSAASGLSALSVDGSSTAPNNWARAVPASHNQQLAGFPDQTGNCHATAQPSTTALPGGPPSAQAHTAASTAGSLLSSHASILQQPRMHSQLLQQQKPQQPSRLSVLQEAAEQPQRADSGVSRRPHIGSFLALSSWGSLAALRSFTARSQPSAAAAGQSNNQQQLPPSKSAADTDMDGTISQQPPLLMPPPTTSAQLQPAVARAKAALAAARLEPWWLRPRGLQHFDGDACMRLLDDIELLLVRLSTLEGVSEERSLMGLHLHQLAHYKGIADALALIFAQLSAFVVHVSTAVGQQETCHCDTHWAPKRGRQGTSSNSSSTARLRPQQVQRVAGAAPLGRHTPQRPSPFATAALGAVGAGPDADGASVGLSTLLSGMERQGSGVSSYLWEKKTGWGQAREMLKRELDASLGHYWWSVRKASKQQPVKVPRSREVMILIFLWPIANGVLDACERIEASAQAVLLRPDASKQAGGAAGAAAAGWSAACSWVLSALPASKQQQQSPPPQQQQQQQQAVKQMHAAAAATARAKLGDRGGLRRARPCAAGMWRKLHQHGQWAGPLLQLMLVKPVLQAVYRAVITDVPAALSSRQGIKDLLASRTFQAAVKLLLSAAAVLATTMLLMVYIPAVASSVPIFGYAAVVLCFQPRVEATVDQAARRVLGTILGACLGLATNSIPGIFESPALLVACLAVASVGLGVLARPQRRTAIVLALLTLCAVSLCGYEAACCSPRGGMSPLHTFVARMASVCGACIFVAVLNRVCLPWYTSDWALEQLADALQQAGVLYGQIYASQLERMRLAELVAEQVKHGDGPEAALLQVHVAAAAREPTVVPPGVAAAPGGTNGVPVTPPPPPAAALAACEAAEAQLLVVLRQQVLGRLVAVQLSLAKESVSWRRGVLATPPLLLNVLGSMNAVKEALTTQRLALAPFTKQGAASMAEQQQPFSASAPTGMLHTMEHCYSMWALPLHPLWLEILGTVQELTAATATHLRRRPHGHAARAEARAQLAALLEQLERQRLDLRHSWLGIRVRLHRAVHGGGGSGSSDSLYPTDSIHLFTFTYGVGRCLNAFAGVAQAVVGSLQDR